MLLTLLGAVATAILGASVAFVIRRVWGAQVRWLVPAAAGAGMLGFTLWNDYSWFARQRDGLPPDVVVTDSFETSQTIQPWSLIWPITNRYRALDRASLVAREDDPQIRRARVFLVARYQPVFETWQIFDCRAGRRADAADAGADGLPPEDAWSDLPGDDPLLHAACAGEAS